MHFLMEFTTKKTYLHQVEKLTFTVGTLMRHWIVLNFIIVQAFLLFITIRTSLSLYYYKFLLELYLILYTHLAPIRCFLGGTVVKVHVLSLQVPLVHHSWLSTYLDPCWLL